MKVVISQQNEPLPNPAEVAAGLVALPGGQAGALALPSRVNIVDTGGAGTAVRVQVVGSRMWQVVHNRTGTNLVVWPAVGTQFEAIGLNLSITIPTNASATYTFDGGDSWVVS